MNEKNHSQADRGNLECKSVSHSVVFNSCDPIDCSMPGFSVHGVLQARILEWVAIPFSRGGNEWGGGCNSE